MGRKAAKIDLYSDKRDADEKATEDTIDKWDQTKLEEVITEMHGAANQTEIVCKYFLDAIEKTQYGWFWTCPNGGKACKYVDQRHLFSLEVCMLYSIVFKLQVKKNTIRVAWR